MANSGDKKVRTYSSQGVDGMERAYQQTAKMPLAAYWRNMPN